MEDAGFQHRALIYEGADEYLGGVVPFLHAALEAGQPALVAVRKEQAELLKGELGGQADLLRFAAIEDLGRNPAAMIPLWRDLVDRSKGRSVRGVGEFAWPDRTRAEMEECHRHEALLNLACAESRSWTLLCPYDACALADDELERVAATHTQISREGRTEESAAFGAELDCLAGELPRRRRGRTPSPSV
jgi:hypothetical protein